MTDTTIEPVRLTQDERRLRTLLDDEWPFHGPAPPGGPSVEPPPGGEDWWVIDRDRDVGLIRLLDLDDVGEGSPRFDLRIASSDGGCGFGTAATRWIVGHLFDRFDDLHRIEANTRADKQPMRCVLEGCRWVHDGTLRRAWRGVDLEWHDTAIYGILRGERPRR